VRGVCAEAAEEVALSVVCCLQCWTWSIQSMYQSQSPLLLSIVEWYFDGGVQREVVDLVTSENVSVSFLPTH
jgi:hypothetical protein